jgi:hypothetical protein
MVRSGSVAVAIAIFLLICSLAGCSSGNSTSTTSFPTPAIISLAPATNASVESGQTLAFTATPKNKSGTAVSTPVQYVSSNTAVMTVADNGDACAGSWDSLSAPQICTAGPVGTAQVYATAQGVSSPPTTVYVHQHIDNIQVSLVPGQNLPGYFGTGTGQVNCFSAGAVFNYQARAFSQGTDITSSVGSFTWQAVNSSVAKLNSTVSGLPLNQLQVTASVPGMTPLFATVGNNTSLPFNFTTCPVQSISLSVSGTNGNSVVVGQGNTVTVSATVVDTAGMTITTAPLSWNSSSPLVVTVPATGTVTGNTITDKASTPLIGGAAVTASCTPPTCNLGILPSHPIYPVAAIDFLVTQGATKPTTASSTVWVTSTGCGTSNGCVSTMTPITVPANTVGTPIGLPATPNSLAIDPKGASAFLGTDLGLLGTKGLMVLNPTSATSTVSSFPSAPGKVLAVSPDGTKAIISDTKDTPVETFLFTCSGSPCGSSSTSTVLPITGATAAAFSPDSLKAYIVAGSRLYVYSTQDALQAVPLSAPGTDVAFLSNGMFGFIAGGSAAGVSFLPTCYDATLGPALGSVSVPVPGAQLIRALPNGFTGLVAPGIPDVLAPSMLVVAPPNAQTIAVGISEPSPFAIGEDGCPAPRGALTVSTTPHAAVNLGQGNFNPTHLLMSSDGVFVYIVTSNLSSIVVFDTANQTPSAMALAGNAIPVSAALSPDGTRLYVGGSDGLVHVLDTSTGLDTFQVTFLKSFCEDSAGNPAQVTSCLPDLIAANP